MKLFCTWLFCISHPTVAPSSGAKNHRRRLEIKACGVAAGMNVEQCLRQRCGNTPAGFHFWIKPHYYWCLSCISDICWRFNHKKKYFFKPIKEWLSSYYFTQVIADNQVESTYWNVKISQNQTKVGLTSISGPRPWPFVFSRSQVVHVLRIEAYLCQNHCNITLNIRETA